MGRGPMRPLPRLGGFKILKDVVWASVTGPAGNETLALRLCRALAAEGVNLAFLTIGHNGHLPGMQFVVEDRDAPAVREALGSGFDALDTAMGRGSVFSLFPHKSDPLVTGTLLEAFGENGIHPLALANSHSAISIVVDQADAEAGVAALFNHFQFSAYRTPADWKLAQEGKETLYREVVASYQEKRPKVYALELYEAQELWDVRFHPDQVIRMARTFEAFGASGRRVTFLISSPFQDNLFNFVFCVPAGPVPDDPPISMPNKPMAAKRDSVTLFSMNGPHFGDRYGISRDLLAALNTAGVALLGLSCSIASITGVISSDQMDAAVNAIQTCFEVPSIITRT